ncbi:MAG: xylulokinase, partial [Anaerolineales bacterium]
AGVGVGVWLSVRQACSEVIKLQKTTSPIKSHTNIYASFYQDYRNLYPALKDINQSLGTKQI